MFRPSLSVLSLLLPAARLCRLAARLRADHLHVHSFANAAHVAALFRKLGGCSYSLTLHGDLEVYGRDHRTKVSAAKFVTCVTTPLRKQVIEKLGLPPSNVHLLWMGVDTKHFCPVERPIRQPHDPLQLLTVARLHENKGHRFALRALRMILDAGLTFQYTIVGDGPARRAVEDEASALGLTKHVVMAGVQSEAEVKRLLQASDALLLTSVGLGEAAPVAIMEAMSCGLSVISSVIGGTPEMIDDGRDGFLVEQGNVDQIADFLRRLSNEPSLAQRIGAAARSRAVRSFDSQSLADSFLRILLQQ